MRNHLQQAGDGSGSAQGGKLTEGDRADGDVPWKRPSSCS